MAEARASIEIEAPAEAVFEYLVTEDGMAAWMGESARLDARVGGDFGVDIAGYPIRGRYLAVEPFHRVVVSWGVAGSDDLPPGTSTVEFVLTPTAVGTRVDLRHGDLPEVDLEGHAEGWRHFLPRLRLAASGVENAISRWRPGQVAEVRGRGSMDDG